MKTQESKPERLGQHDHTVSAPESAVQPKTMTPPAFQLKASVVSQLVAESEQGESEGEVVQQKVSSGPDAAAADPGDGGSGGGNGGGGGSGGGNGLPNDLRSGIEQLSGFDMGDVNVHYGSSKPKDLGAHAYAQGTDIHIAPGQEQHLAHEAWHVAQQKQGRVQATKQLKGMTPINDDAGLEHEADVMGAKAMQLGKSGQGAVQKKAAEGGAVQRKPLQFKLTGGMPLDMLPAQLMPLGGVAQLNGMKLGVLGDQAMQLGMSYVNTHWDELMKTLGDKINGLVAGGITEILKALSTYFGLDELAKRGAEAVQTLTKYSNIVGQILNVLTTIKGAIDMVPEPVKEFLKYLIGYLIKKLGEWSKKLELSDEAINVIVIDGSTAAGYVGWGIEKLQVAQGYVSSALAKIGQGLSYIPGSGLVARGGSALINGAASVTVGTVRGAVGTVKGAVNLVRSGIAWARGSESGSSTSSHVDPQAEGQEGGEVASKTPETSEQRAKRLDLEFLWVEVNPPKVERWDEKITNKDTDEEETIKRGGAHLTGSFGIRLNGREIKTDVDIKLTYGGNYRVDLTGPTTLIDSLALGQIVQIQQLNLDRLKLTSEEGLTILAMSTKALSIANGVLTGEDLSFKYDKGNKKAPLKIKAGKLGLNAFGAELEGSADMDFDTLGKLSRGVFTLGSAQSFDLIPDHLTIGNLQGGATWEDQHFSAFNVNGNVAAKLGGVKVSGTGAGLNYTDKDGLMGVAENLTLEVPMGEKLLTITATSVKVNGEDGFRAASVNVRYAPKPLDQQAGSGDDEAGKANLVKQLVPNFNLGWIGEQVGIDEVDVTVSNAKLGGTGRPVQGPATEDGQAPVAIPQEPVVPENVVTLNSLKAHAFGFNLTGQYANKVFNGTFNSEEFGGGAFTVDSSDPKKWVASAADVDLQFGGRKLFGVFGVDSIHVANLKYVQGLGVQVLDMNIKGLKFGNSLLNVAQITGVLDGETLKFAGTGVELDLFGQKFGGAFKFEITKAGKVQLIQAGLTSVTDIEVIKDVLKLKELGGTLNWGDGKLKEASMHSGMEVNLPGVQLTGERIGFGYEETGGLYAEAQDLKLGLNVAEGFQVLLRLQGAKVSKGEGGVQFVTKKVSASFAHGANILGEGPKKDGLNKSKVSTLLPAVDTKWMDFAGVKVLVFTLGANDIAIDKTGLKVGSWTKVIDAVEASLLGMEMGYSSGNSDLGLEGLAGKKKAAGEEIMEEHEKSVKPPLDRGTRVDESQVEAPQGGDVAQKSNAGGWMNGKWNKKLALPNLSVDVPVLPGLSLGGGITASVGLGAHVGAQMEKLEDEGGKERYRLGGNAGLSLTGSVKVDIHASIGNALIVAIQAGLFAEAEVKAQAEGAITGVVIWDKAKNSLSLSDKTSEKPKVTASLSANLSAAVGAEIRAKAFLVFDKQLWRYEFKRWNLGDWIVQGELSQGEDGGMAFKRSASGFGKEGGLPSSKPDIDYDLVTPEEALDGLGSDEKITDSRTAWQIYHDIKDPNSGYSRDKQAELLQKLRAKTKSSISFNPGSSDEFDTMTEGLAERLSHSDPSLMMGSKEWQAYSTTSWGDRSLIKDRKSVKAVDLKVTAFGAASGKEAKIAVLKGSLTNKEVATELPKVDLENPTRGDAAPIYAKAGLIDVCDLYLIKKKGKGGRVASVAKLRADAESELARLLRPEPPREDSRSRVEGGGESGR